MSATTGREPPLTPILGLIALLTAPPAGPVLHETRAQAGVKQSERAKKPARPGNPSDSLTFSDAEATRLWQVAQARRAEVAGAVELVRLEALSDWISPGWLDARLAEAAVDTKRPPLVQAVAWGLIRDRALDHLDAEGAARAAQALGLLDGFAVRTGSAPHPTAVLTPEGWLPYPAGVGAGTLRLETVLQPDTDTTAILAGRLVAKGGPAVLRIGYDDEATLWLNGDELHKAPAPHDHALDQVAIPVVLRPGDNRLVVAVRQVADAWRFSVRVTDGAGRPLPASLHPDPWGPVPDPADDVDMPPPDDLWTTLSTAAEGEAPEAQTLRDLADFARFTGLPDREQAVPRVAIEGAWEADPSSTSLLAWLRILPLDEAPAVRAAHEPVRPERQADVYADLVLRLDEGWNHYYARRFLEVGRIVEALKAQAPDFLPVYGLEAVMLQELGLPATAVRRLSALEARFADRPGLRRGRVAALRSGERVEEALSALEALARSPHARADDLFQLASLRATRGETDAALALLDRVIQARPDLRTFAFEAVDVALAAGREDAARARLVALLERMPGDGPAAERLAGLLRAAGQPAEAEAVLRRALAAHPGDPTLTEALGRLAPATPALRLGPALDDLAATPSPPGVAAHVLYHHARSELDAAGRATRRLRKVVRILNEEGARRFAEWSLTFVPGTQHLQLEEARLVRPGQPARSPTRSDRDLSAPEYRLYYDLRAEVLDFPPLLPGDLVEVAWRVTDTDPDPAFPGYYGEVAWMQEVAPRALSVVEWAGATEHLQVAVVPRGTSLHRPDPQVLRFEARDVPGLPLESDAPGLSSLLAHVHVSTLKDWTELDTRYRALLADRDRPDERLAALAREWGGEGTREEVLDRLYAAVAHRTRYVGLEFGVRGFRPEQPSVTLARGFGDCKDKATLLIALARARGIDARLTLVRTRSAGAVENHPASFALFDHAIVYVPEFNRFLDPTVDRNDPGTLPPSDQGGQAFVVGLDTALRAIPPETAEQNRSEWRIEGRLTATGDIEGRFEWTTRGQPATAARRALEAEGAQRQTLEALLSAWFRGAAVQPEAFEGLMPAFDPVVVRGTVRLPGVAPGGRLPLTGTPWDVLGRFAQAAQRQLPLELELQQTTRLVLDLDVGAARVPEPVEITSEFGRFDARARIDGPRLVLEAVLAFEVSEVPPEKYAAFRAWLAQVDGAAQRLVEVRR
jgi:transglutaminase-like putative cysteine protease/thioredoxin-like negative regulator of GroEL